MGHFYSLESSKIDLHFVGGLTLSQLALGLFSFVHNSQTFLNNFIHLITCQNVPNSLRTQPVCASIQYGQSLLLAIYGKNSKR